MKTENVEIKPSYGGNECLGNGTHDNMDIQCDECNYYLECFPQKNSSSSINLDINIAEIIVERI